MCTAVAYQILVSSTVRDLVPGSGIRFGDGQTLDFEGPAGPRVVFPVLSRGAPPETVRRLAIDQANVLRRDGEYWTAAYGETGAKARQEIDALVQELSSAFGLGGKARRTPDHVERARKAVARRIRDAVARIDRAHPALGRHLHASLQTGVFCSYTPERDIDRAIDRGDAT